LRGRARAAVGPKLAKIKGASDVTKFGDLLPQSHGGALRPYTSGTGAAAARSSVRAIRKEAARMFAAATPEIAAKLIETVLTTNDERTRAVIGMGILDRVLGRATEQPQAADDTRPVDISYLSAADRARLSDAFETVFELLGIGPGRLPDA